MDNGDAPDFKRGRGIVWVCDLVGSSKYLNKNETVGPLEEFLPRFLWAGRLYVEASGGTFVKWTGDGFLAWFPIELERDIQPKATELLTALWHLSLLVNVTQLGVRTDKAKFRVRHGVTYEPDALLFRLPSGAPEIIGRNVTLAFRLCGIPAAMPGLVTHRSIIEPFEGALPGEMRAERWRPNAEELLKYFKGERWQTNALYRSTDKRRRPVTLAPTAKKATDIVSKLDGIMLELAKNENTNALENVRQQGLSPGEAAVADPSTTGKILVGMLSGPTWAREAMMEIVTFAKGLHQTLKTFVDNVPALKRVIEKARVQSDEKGNLDAPKTHRASVASSPKRRSTKI